MKKTLRVTLDLEVADLTKAAREACLSGMGETEPDLPRLKDHLQDGDGLSEIADVLRGLGNEEMSQELLAGSNLYLRFTGCKIVSREWRP
jgi:hypothetical protein